MVLLGTASAIAPANEIAIVIGTVIGIVTVIEKEIVIGTVIEIAIAPVIVTGIVIVIEIETVIGIETAVITGAIANASAGVKKGGVVSVNVAAVSIPRDPMSRRTTATMRTA